MKFYFNSGNFTFEDLGRITKVLIPVLGNPKQITTNTEKGVLLSKTWGWEIQGIETFIKVYETCKKAGIIPKPTENFSFPFQIPPDWFMTSFYDSDDPVVWRQKNDEKKFSLARSKKKRQEKREANPWSDAEKLREVNTTLTGKCSLHSHLRTYKFALGRCEHCEEIKKKRGLANMVHQVHYDGVSWHNKDLCKECQEIKIRASLEKQA